MHALIGADRVSSYRSAEQRVEDLRFFAAINEVRSRCRTNGDDLEVDIAFEIVAERGPALAPDSLELAYFVATLDPAERLLAKQVFPAELRFGADGIAGYRETLTLQLPGVDPRSSPMRRLLVGFSLEHVPPPAASSAAPTVQAPARP